MTICDDVNDGFRKNLFSPRRRGDAEKTGRSLKKIMFDREASGSDRVPSLRFGISEKASLGIKTKS
jgi:hypothetical protein